MGFVYYANYLVWFEVARAELLRTLGWTYREMEESGVWLPVIEAHCEYRRPARYDDEIDVHAEGRLMSPVRIAFDYRAVLRAEGETLATGHTVHAAMAPGGRLCRLPDRIRAVMQ